jgi:hypothetical protein
MRTGRIANPPDKFFALPNHPAHNNSRAFHPSSHHLEA